MVSKMVRCLEVFCGTSSISRECSNRGWEVITVDLLKKFNPTICCDIMNLDYESLGTFDYMHAGIPCTTYSIASCKRNPEVGNKLAIKTLEILDFLLSKNPSMLWSFENPYSSLLRKQPFMLGLPYKICDYCQYGTRDEDNMGYKKRTIIFGNFEWDARTCPGAGLCPEMIGRHHKEVAQHGIQAGTPPGIQKRNFSQTQLYRMPPKLCVAMCDGVAQQLGGAHTPG
jgi:hypothetical protein